MTTNPAVAAVATTPATPTDCADCAAPAIAICAGDALCGDCFTQLAEYAGPRGVEIEMPED